MVSQQSAGGEGGLLQFPFFRIVEWIEVGTGVGTRPECRKSDQGSILMAVRELDMFMVEYYYEKKILRTDAVIAVKENCLEKCDEDRRDNTRGR